jgi:hypothetical protein
VQQHQGIIVDVDDAALQGRPLGHLRFSAAAPASSAAKLLDA